MGLGSNRTFVCCRCNGVGTRSYLSMIHRNEANLNRAGSPQSPQHVTFSTSCYPKCGSVGNGSGCVCRLASRVMAVCCSLVCAWNLIAALALADAFSREAPKAYRSLGPSILQGQRVIPGRSGVSLLSRHCGITRPLQAVDVGGECHE
jgi:hypothetical protein